MLRRLHMNNKTYYDLSELGIFSSKNLSETDYNNLSKNNVDKSKIYLQGYSNDVRINNDNKWYKEIDTHGLSVNDVLLQLEIMRTKHTKTIKNMVTFFVLLTIISIVILIILSLNGITIASQNRGY